MLSVSASDVKKLVKGLSGGPPVKKEKRDPALREEQKIPAFTTKIGFGAV